MLPFAHVGLTLGAAWLIKGGLARGQMNSVRPVEGRGKIKPTAPLKLAESIDYRVVMVGALLPDIIDKPIGDVIFRNYFGQGRIFCHTLLFLIILTTMGIYLYKSRRKLWLLLLAFGTFTHLILDGMWLEPRTILWPIYGVTFPREESTTFGNWINDMWNALKENPLICAPEVIGAVILVIFFAVLIRKRKLYAFIRYGLT